ncbi:MAG: AMP-binding protein, partial [Gemmatimonadetes bacterium]|nr:AMP-binding protein [Gemmatimonadota bacterium]
MSTFVWHPSPGLVAQANITRFMRAHGFTDVDAFVRRTIEDQEWFWDAVVKDQGIRWTRPYTRVLDSSRGIMWPRWFPDGLLNLTDNCVDRHLDAGRGDQAAVVWEGDGGETRTLTYREMAREVGRLANALRTLGVGRGDRVGVFLPMSPEAAIATMAVTRIGAVYTPCFSGFGAQAVASRLQDSEAVALITADGFHRRGQVVRMKETADEAVAACPSVRHVIVYRRLGRDIPWTG